MIVLGLGANLESRRGTAPAESLDLASARLGDDPEIKVAKRSPWFESAPVPASDQPWYVNGVLLVESDLRPDALLAKIKRIEAWFGRRDETRNAPRPMDIDILDYKGKILPGAAAWKEAREASRPELVLPHPRLHERRFVLAPLAALASDWSHPVFGATAAELLARLDDDPSLVRPLDRARRRPD